MILKIVWSVFMLIIPYILGHILDRVVPETPEKGLWPIFQWGGIMLLFAAGCLITGVWANRNAARIARDVTGKMRQDLFDSILSLSAHQVDTFTIPSLVARMSSDTYTTHNMILVLFRSAVHNLVLFFTGIAVTLTVEPALGSTFVVLLPILGVIVYAISRKGAKLYKVRQGKVDAMVRVVRDAFTGIRVIKALSKVDHEKEHFHTVKTDLSRAALKAGRTVSVSKSLISLFLNLGMTSVIVIGAYRVVSGHTQPGQIISFMSYFTIILNATITMTRVFTAISAGAASAARIFEVIDTKPELLLDAPAEPEDNAPFLEFRDVTFSYNKTLPTVQHISFTLKKGETLGVIGGTGSGKSTLLQLLLRFYDPDEGKILLEGRDLRAIPPEELHARFGVVFQNDFLAAESISENIRFARRVNGDGIRKAAELAQATSFIERNEEGFNYDLTAHGSNLSGGQRQRLLVARAVAARPEILLLDDASSALDYKTDAAMRRAIRAEFTDTTTVIVAQRVSSVRASDLILVLEHGEMIGLGKDEELMETCEIYREIAKSQMGEFQG